MMINICVLDADLKIIGVVDSYASLIWSKRYAELGDCELYVPASPDLLSLLAKGNYLARLDDDMVCRIEKVEVTTSAEEGDFITVTGSDSKKYIDQRIIWGTETCNGNVEEFARKLVTDALITPANPDRALLKANDEPLLVLDSSAGLPAVASEQVSYLSVGEKIRDYCISYGYGYRCRGDLRNRVLRFGMYAGTDRHDSVIFSNEYDNLVSSDYVDDVTNMGNVALVGGQGEGSERILDVYGGGYGANRYEHFIDASDVSPDITYAELKALYPLVSDGGTAYITGSGEEFYYKVGQLDIQVMSDEHLESLEAAHPGGQLITISGHRYYRLADETAASLTANPPEDDGTVTLTDLVYDVYLLSRGREALAEYGRVVTFNGAIIPDVTFVYGQDYFLGDLVTVENKFGIRSTARITEIVEVLDAENGYTFEPTFEFIETVEGRPAGANNLMTENSDDILTETNVTIMVEE